MPNKRANVKNEKQYEALKDKGMSKERAARIANSPGASSRGVEESGSGGSSSQGGTTAQKKAAGRKGGKATACKQQLRVADRPEIGYALSSEEHGPADLVRYAALAEERGFRTRSSRITSIPGSTVRDRAPSSGRSSARSPRRRRRCGSARASPARPFARIPRSSRRPPRRPPR